MAFDLAALNAIFETYYRPHVRAILTEPSPLFTGGRRGGKVFPWDSVNAYDMWGRPRRPALTLVFEIDGEEVSASGLPTFPDTYTSWDIETAGAFTVPLHIR